jgi:hypothetical protein
MNATRGVKFLVLRENRLSAVFKKLNFELTVKLKINFKNALSLRFSSDLIFFGFKA